MLADDDISYARGARSMMPKHERKRTQDLDLVLHFNCDLWYLVTEVEGENFISMRRTLMRFLERCDFHLSLRPSPRQRHQPSDTKLQATQGHSAAWAFSSREQK